MYSDSIIYIYMSSYVCNCFTIWPHHIHCHVTLFKVTQFLFPLTLPAILEQRVCGTWFHHELMLRKHPRLEIDALHINQIVGIDLGRCGNPVKKQVGYRRFFSQESISFSYYKSTRITQKIVVDYHNPSKIGRENSGLALCHKFAYYMIVQIPSKIKRDLTNGPLGKVLELLDTQV